MLKKVIINYNFILIKLKQQIFKKLFQGDMK